MKILCHAAGLAAAIAAIPTLAAAAPCSESYYFKTGQDVESTTLDEQGRVKNRKLSTVAKVTGTPDDLTATVSTETYDASGKLLSTVRTLARCEKAGLLLDLTSGLPASDGGLRGREPVWLLYPADMTPGQVLDVRVNFDLDGSTGGKAMKVNFNLADRRVAAAREIDTPLGRRPGFLITSVLNVSFKVVGIAIPMRYDLTEYYAPGVGVVRSEAAQKGRVVERSDIVLRPGR